MAVAQKAWTKCKAAYTSFMNAWESPLSVLGGVFLGALASMCVVAKFDAHIGRRTCSFEGVRAAFSSEQQLGALQNWSAEACDGILSAPFKIPDYFTNIFEEENLANKKDKLEDRLRKRLQEVRDAESEHLQFWKILIAAVALLWLYAFNSDVYRKTRLAEGKTQDSARQEQKSESNSSPRRLKHRAKLSRNRWALVCYGFAASASIYFTASMAGTAAANLLTSNIYQGDNIRIGGDRETIRELHFAQFLEREIDPRPYDRLAWHFFFKEGNMQGGSCAVCAEKIGEEGLEFRDNLSTTAIHTRLQSIIKALSACASSGKPVRLWVTAQSSRRAWCGCTPARSDDLNKKLAEARAARIRQLLEDALAKLDDSVNGKFVVLNWPIDPYPFDFSDKQFHATNGIPPGESVPPSPYYLAQTAALVLEDPSTCAVLRTSDDPQP